MTNKRVAEINEISYEVRRRRWNWLGHILRKEGENDCFTALGWIPECRRTRGRAKKLLGDVQRRKSEAKAGWKSWEVAKAVAQDRKCWSDET